MKAALVFIAGTIAFYLAGEAAWFAYAKYAQLADREGGLGMAVVFVIGPLCAAALGAATAFIFGGPQAPRQIKIAGAIIGILILASLVKSLIGL